MKRTINKPKKKSHKKKLEIKKNSKPLNKTKKDERNLTEVINKRYNSLIFIVIILYVVILGRVFYLQIIKENDYKESLAMATEKTVESTSAPRGRIYDRNYNLLVDNEGVKTIYYKKQNGITNKEEIELAYTVADNINLDYSKVNENRLKTFYYKGHYKECKKKITDKEWEEYNKRKLNGKDIEKLIYERLDEDMPYYDKYMMNELNKFTKNVLEEYNNYNFQNVYKLVNNFVSFTLSNFYLDFTKDILYIEKADSLVRRSVQTVLYNILNNEVKLLAPILPYTSEEVYSLLPHTEESVHLTDMPEVVTYSDSTEVEELFNLFFELKDKVNKKLEEARNEKLIGSALEAVVKINLDPKYNEVKEKLGSYLHQLFIVSKVEYTTDGEEVVVEKSTGEKCNRCWNYVDHLNGDICDRCHNIINS